MLKKLWQWIRPFNPIVYPLGTKVVLTRTLDPAGLFPKGMPMTIIAMDNDYGYELEDIDGNNAIGIKDHSFIRSDFHV